MRTMTTDPSALRRWTTGPERPQPPARARAELRRASAADRDPILARAILIGAAVELGSLLLLALALRAAWGWLGG